MTNAAADETFLTLEEVAHPLRLEPSTVYSLTRARSNSRPHRIPFVVVERKLRFRKSAILTWLADLEAARV
jgi:excisionase family DNA binding protein